jgi:hypothetical protein
MPGLYSPPDESSVAGHRRSEVRCAQPLPPNDNGTLPSRGILVRSQTQKQPRRAIAITKYELDARAG